MKVSKDRVNWKTLLGTWYMSDTGIIASNSDNIQTTDTAMSLPQSNCKKTIAKQYLQSRVINVSGLIIANNIYECRKQEREIRNDLLGEELYFYDEFTEQSTSGNPIEGTGKVIKGYVPNINDSIGRGEFDGRTALINFNITLLSPYFEELDKTVQVFNMTGQDSITIDNNIEDDVCHDTEYTVEVQFASPRVVTGIFTGLLEFEAPLSVSTGDSIFVSSENQDFIAKKNTSSILGNVENSYFTNGYILKSGSTSFIIPVELRTSCTITVSYYKRVL